MGCKDRRLGLTFYFVLFSTASLILIRPFTAAAQERSPTDGPYAVGSGVQAPIVLFQPLPTYTDEARAARIEGIVLLQAIIRKNGTVDSFRVTKGLGYGLDESAINTIATRWKFQPGTRNGEPVDVQANIEVSFRLYTRPEDAERLKAFSLSAAIVQARWNQDSSGTTLGSGHGNLIATDSTRGFTYTTTCSPVFRQGVSLPAKWSEPDSLLEIVTGVDPGGVRTCELKATMKSTVFALRNGQVVEVGPSDTVGK